MGKKNLEKGREFEETTRRGEMGVCQGTEISLHLNARKVSGWF